MSVKMSLTEDFPGGPTIETPVATASGIPSIPGGGTKIPHATKCHQKANN